MSNSLGLVERIFIFLRKKSARRGKGLRKNGGALIEQRLFMIEARLDRRDREDHRRAVDSATFFHLASEIHRASGLEFHDYFIKDKAFGSQNEDGEIKIP
jgi:hypothetical protein